MPVGALTFVVNTSDAPDELPAVFRADFFGEGLQDLDCLLSVYDPACGSEHAPRAKTNRRTCSGPSEAFQAERDHRVL